MSKSHSQKCDIADDHLYSKVFHLFLQKYHIAHDTTETSRYNTLHRIMMLPMISGTKCPNHINRSVMLPVMSQTLWGVNHIYRSVVLPLITLNVCISVICTDVRCFRTGT